jgi:hypothetical protein
MMHCILAKLIRHLLLKYPNLLPTPHEENTQRISILSQAFTSYTASYENKAAMSSLTDVMELYREQPTRHPTLVSSSTSSLQRHNKEYMPAWSLYGSTVDDVNNPDPYANQS